MEGFEWEIFLRGTADFPTGLAPALTLCKGGCSSVIIFTCSVQAPGVYLLPERQQLLVDKAGRPGEPSCGEVFNKCI